MRNELGIGGIKFQNLITQELHSLKGEPRTSLQMMLSQRSQQEVIKRMEELEDSPPHILSKKREKQFKLEVSSDSSSFSISSNGSSRSQRSYQSTNHLQQQQAAASLKLLIKETKKPMKLSTISSVKPQIPQKKAVKFLRGLQQNSELSETDTIQELYQNGRIKVKLKSEDFMTFMRWQHEIEELKRKKNDFDEQKERHFQLTKGNFVERLERQKRQTELLKKKNKYSESWITGITLAKRFLQIGRQKARNNLQRQAIKTLTGLQSLRKLSDSNDEVKSMASFREIHHP